MKQQFSVVLASVSKPGKFELTNQLKTPTLDAHAAISVCRPKIVTETHFVTMVIACANLASCPLEMFVYQLHRL